MLGDQASSMMFERRHDRGLERFRFYHPETIRQLALVAGFDMAEVFAYPGRVAFARLTKN
jgi:hypothetical protein